jgi:tetratricopeptide (TPR) repeat protein
MTRLIFYSICAIVLTITSCNNATVQSDQPIAEQEKELRDIVSHFPDSILARENLIQYFRENGNYGQAITETDFALQRDSLNDRFHDIKATLYFENGDTIQAIQSFEKAILINPKTVYIISLGSLYAQTKNPRALTLADALLAATGANAQQQALFIKGLYFSHTGDKRKAIVYFNNCLQLDYRNMMAYREKAICLFDLVQYELALEVMKNAVTVQKTFDEGYYWMGRCYEKLGKRKEAIENYELALQIDANYLEAKDALKRCINIQIEK